MAGQEEPADQNISFFCLSFLSYPLVFSSLFIPLSHKSPFVLALDALLDGLILHYFIIYYNQTGVKKLCFAMLYLVQFVCVDLVDYIVRGAVCQHFLLD